MESSERLFQAYSHEFGMSVLKHPSLLIDNSHNFELLEQWSGYVGVHAWHKANVEEQMRPQLRGILASLYFRECADLVGVMFLDKVFEGWLERNDVSSQSTSEVLQSEAQMFYEAIMGLYPPPPVPTPRANLAIGLDEAFGAEYMDPHNMVSYYAHELQRMSKEWFEERERYMAPYTSIVTSSMMGKSRLVKEMAS